jgi:hypothetical protein
MTKDSFYLNYKFAMNVALFWRKVSIISFRIYTKFKIVNKFGGTLQNKISRKFFGGSKIVQCRKTEGRTGGRMKVTVSQTVANMKKQ